MVVAAAAKVVLCESLNQTDVCCVCVSECGGKRQLEDGLIAWLLRALRAVSQCQSVFLPAVRLYFT